MVFVQACIVLLFSANFFEIKQNNKLKKKSQLCNENDSEPSNLCVKTFLMSVYWRTSVKTKMSQQNLTEFSVVCILNILLPTLTVLTMQKTSRVVLCQCFN